MRALALWTAPRRRSRGRSAEILGSGDHIVLDLRVVYGLALRQTQGLMRSVAALMEFDIAVCLTSPPCRAGAKGWRCRRQSPEPERLVLLSGGR
ncbi:transposase [Rhizobium beringeri]|uniref:transposase n=1 Tax=Rhizobium beringeri TaxID=3019934 RepID=UPI003B5C0D7C